MHVTNVSFLFSVNGAWNEWTDWSACGASCGDSVQMRNRSCSNPRPNDYGDDCEGDETETQACNIAECPGKIYCLHLQYKT